MRKLTSSTRRLVAAGLVVAGGAAAVGVAASSGQAPSRPFLPAACVSDRGIVRTLSDRPHLLPLRGATISYLAGRPRPSKLDSTRKPFEHHLFRVTGSVTVRGSKAAADLRLVIRNGKAHMVAAVPPVSCTGQAGSTRRLQMHKARKAIRSCKSAVVAGVAFFGRPQPQGASLSPRTNASAPY